MNDPEYISYAMTETKTLQIMEKALERKIVDEPENLDHPRRLELIKQIIGERTLTHLITNENFR